MRRFFLMLSKCHLVLRKSWTRLLMHLYKYHFKAIGNNVIFDPLHSTFSYPTISIGNHVFIAAGAWFSSDRSLITIGSYVMFGPNVSIFGGDHDMSQNDKPMIWVNNKRSGLDAEIIIEDDVWIGANVVITKGVTIGRGAVIGAGSIVVNDVEPFGVYAGVPARKLKARFSADAVVEYERAALSW